MTRAQRAVLAALADASGFRSAQQIHAQMRERGDRIGLTSVYRALQGLSDAGAVDVLRSRGGEASYRRCDSDRHHHHLVCGECGATVEVEAPALERWLAQVAAQHDFAVAGHTLEVVGRCSQCRNG
ncbi:MAG TPA: Fur family transcriptional regulator [Mycobacteriales bacterium]|nr:Fur family transcriptional regulator [Mycobacteriales bacterium]